jgi:hypothetical protein
MPSRYRKVLNPASGRYVRKHGAVGCAVLYGKSRRSRSRSRRARSPPRPSQKRSHRRKIRRSPHASATLFAVGTVQEGNDGNMWRIRKVSGGVKRWQRV